MKECFIERKFQQKTLLMIEKANAIIEEYQAQDFILTLRQLYYQMVARDVLENKLRNYNTRQ